MTGPSTRPATLTEVATRVLAVQQAFDPALQDFLDEIYAHPTRRQAALPEEPALIQYVRNACTAVVAEHLASRYGRPTLSWADDHGQPPKRAFFTGNLESLKAIPTVESPAAFQRRLLFLEKDAMDRPGRQIKSQTQHPELMR